MLFGFSLGFTVQGLGLLGGLRVGGCRAQSFGFRAFYCVQSFPLAVIYVATISGTIAARVFLLNSLGLCIASCGCHHVLSPGFQVRV